MSTPGLLVLPGAEPALSDTAQPISGATLTVYITGTMTLASIYADSGFVTAITNPQTANSAGRFFAQSTTIWADATQNYDCVLAYPSTGQSFTFDDVPLVSSQASVSGFAPINSPNFTGVPTAPTPALNDSSSKLATTAYVKGQNYAALNSPALSGTPTAPTASSGTNTTQIATTAFVETAVMSSAQSLASPGYATLPGGLILEWGTGTTSGGSLAVTFPKSFPNACFSVVVACDAANAAFANIKNGTLSTSGMTIQTWIGTSTSSSDFVRWFAVGN